MSGRNMSCAQSTITKDDVKSAAQIKMYNKNIYIEGTNYGNQEER